jgi:hypothetical protein
VAERAVDHPRAALWSAIHRRSDAVNRSLEEDATAASGRVGGSPVNVNRFVKR